MDHASHLAVLSGGALPATAIAAALLVTGAVGSITHCTAMCGPFVLAQAAGGDRGRPLRRLARGLQMPYHLGRLTTYTLLGAGLGALGQTVAALTQLRWPLAACLALAALLFLGRALGVVLPAPRPARPGAATQRLGVALARLAAPLLSEPGPWRGYLLGVTLGFLPCGFLYAALAAAAGAGSAAAGGLAMAGFAVGTVPALALLGGAGSTLLGRCRGAARLVAPPVHLVNAGILAAMAVRLVG